MGFTHSAQTEKCDANGGFNGQFRILHIRCSKFKAGFAAMDLVLLHVGEEQPSKIFNLDASSLNEVFRTMFNYNYPAKCRAGEKCKPKE